MIDVQKWCRCEECHAETALRSVKNVGHGSSASNIDR
jgi:hypothetical protein